MFTFEHLADPARIAVSEQGSRVATFTMGCYTVTLAGPLRTFRETFRRNGANVTVQVTHGTWVRAAPGPVDETIDERWLRLALAANQDGVPDALALAMQYVKGAPPLLEGAWDTSSRRPRLSWSSVQPAWRTSSRPSREAGLALRGRAS